MKKFVALLLSLLLVFSMAVSAAADLLWEPRDSYYQEQTDYPRSSLYCVYYVPKGLTCTVYRSPADPTVLAVLDPGAEIYVGFSLTIDEEEWGVGAVHGSDVEGCFRLGRLQREYDHGAFRQDHLDQLEETDTTFIYAEDVSKELLFWRYPGSGENTETIAKEYLPDRQNPDDHPIRIQYVYTDDEIGTWGYVSYYYGTKGWVWLDDPGNPDAPLSPREYPNTVTDTSPTEEPPKTAVLTESPDSSALYLIVGLVAAVVVVTGIIIVILKRKNKEKLP